MREYELMVIFHPDLDEKAMSESINRISSWITDDGGEIVKTDVWGKRVLAYPIRKQSQGQYVLLHTKMAPTLGTTLERNLGFLEPVMRYLIVAKE
jgi:small subunit ribosomal protein S6